MITPQRLGRTFLLTVGFGCAAALAGTFNFDFNSDPATILDFCGTAWDGSATSNTGSASWVTSGGAGPLGNTATGPVAGVPSDGFLRLTFASPDCRGALSSSLCGGVLFNDFDVGMVVAAFTFECDLRLGNGGERPADGFSLSYVRAGDPVLLALAAGDTLPNMNHWISANGGQFADNGSAGDLSLIEEGTQTGLSIGFDLWASGGYTIPPVPPAVGKVAPGLTQDDIGLDVRVDGTLLATIPMPNLEPVSGDDPTSLATGPYDGTGCDTNLAWVHFKADLDTAGVLSVWYKNTRLLTNFATRYYPSPGRLLLAARVGAATANVEVDNIQITTLPASEVAIGPVSGTATGFSLSVTDSGPAVADPATVQVRLNGAAITPAVSKTGGTTTISYNDPVNPFPPGATMTVTVSLKQTNGQQVGPVDRTYVVPMEPGQVKWSFTTGGGVISSPAIGADGTVYVGSDCEKLYALDGVTGAQKWWAPVTGGNPGYRSWSSPAIGLDGTVYVGSTDSKVYALAGGTGAQRWSFATGGQVISSPAIGPDGTVYVGSYDQKLYALDGATGVQKWAVVTDNAVVSSPAVGADGTVFVGSLDGTVYALDGASGARKWTFLTGNIIHSSPALGADGSVYVGSADGKLYALVGTTGTLKWSFATAAPFDASPAIGPDSTVYVGSFDQKVYALDGATGTQKWAFATGDLVNSSPAIAADGTVYVGSLDNRVYALDGVTGVQKWTFLTGGDVESSPAIGVDGTVYVGSGDGKLYALRGSAGLANTPWPKFHRDPQNTGRAGAGEPAEPATVVAEPEDATAIVGTGVSFAVTANGTAPLSYSWRKDDAVLVEGARITGVNTARLSLSDVLTSDAGWYQVVVTNSFGSVTSRSAVLTVSARAPGQKLWEFQTGGIVWSSPAIGTDGTVYVGSSARRVYALDGATGKERWEVPVGGGEMWCSPAIGADGTVYVGSSDNRLFALNGATGAKLWEFKAGGGVLSSPALATDGTVYIGSSDSKVHALNGATGQSLWEFQTEGAVSSSPAIGADGTLYVGSNDQKIYALNGATGTKRWEFQADSAVNSSPAIGANGTVYLGSASGKVYALNGTTGQKLWEFARIPDEALFVLSSSPVLGADETVYVGSGSPDNKVYALNGATGAKLWEFQTGWYVLSSPAIGADGTLYVGSLDGNVYALSGATGEKRWEYYVGDQVWSSPAVGSDGTVYVGSYNGKVYALSSNSLGGLAASPWPKFHANALNQGRVRTTTGPARIVTQSAGRMVVEGTPLVLEVMAEGASPLRYEWFLNGQLLADATGPAYRVQAWAANQAGVYRVRVSNAEGAAESAEMAVTSGYAVTIAVVGAGGVKGTNASGIYAPGAVLELTAVAAEGCLEPGCWFAGWSGDVSGQANPLRLTVDRTWRLTATFGGTKPGMLRWEFRAAGPVHCSPAIGVDGTVYAAADYPARSVYALNAATGQRLWEFQTSCCNVRSSPAVGSDGTVYVGSGDSRVYALDGATGSRRWEFQTGSSVFSSPAVGSDGTVYVGSSDNKIYALNGATGQKLWEFAAGDQMAHVVSSSPAIGSDGTVYVGSADAKVYALHGATGQKRWEFATGGEVWSSPAIGADGTVYVGSNDNKVYALNGATGEKRWEFATGGEVWSSPAIGADGTVYVGSSDEKVYALNGTTGQKLWEFQTGFYVSSSPAIGADGTVYVGSNDNSIYALNGTTGLKLWEYRTGAIELSSPVIAADGTVYVGSVEGRLYALSSSSVGGLANSPWPKFRQNARNTGRVEAPSAPPQITEQPVGIRVPVGGDFQLSVSARGSAPLAYQWFHGGQPVPEAVSNVLSVTSATLDDSGDYQVTVNNVAGAVTSPVARVVVGYVLTLTTNGVGSVQAEPPLEVYEPGQTVVLTATPGVGRTFVGWQGDASGTGNPFTLTVNLPMSVRATFSHLPDDQASMTLTFLPESSPPFPCCYDGRVTSADPLGPTYGASVMYNGYLRGGSAEEVNGAYLVYRFRLDFAEPAVIRRITMTGLGDHTSAGNQAVMRLLDASHQVLSITSLTDFNTLGTWTVVGTDTVGTTFFYEEFDYSTDGRLRTGLSVDAKYALAPSLRQPSRVVLNEGTTGKIAVKVAGEPVPAMRWHFNGEPIPGATEATLTIPSVTRAAEGMYTVVASNAVGQVTSQPIFAPVSNVDPQTFLGLKWEGGNAGPVSLEATTQLDETAVWQPWFQYPASGMAQQYVELDLTDATRFYRLNAANAVRFTAAGLLKGWWMVDPLGTRVRVETVSAATGWTHWQVLTDLTLPASPYLFLDLENVGPVERVYRTTVVP